MLRRRTRLGVVLGPRVVACVLGWMLALTACGPAHVPLDGPYTDDETQAERLLQEGLSAKRDGDLETAKLRLREVVVDFEKTESLPAALGLLGEILFHERGCGVAKTYLERLVEHHPLHPDAKEAKRRLIECAGVPRVAAPGDFRARFENEKTDAGRKKVAASAAEAALVGKDFAGAVSWLLRVWRLEADEVSRRALEAEAIEIIDDRVSFKGIRKLLESVEGVPSVEAFLSYKLARIQHHTRNFSGADETLSAHLRRWQGGTYQTEAQALLKRIRAKGFVKPDTIGAILPLTGKHRVYGDYAKQAIELALAGLKNRGPKIKLVIRDTQSDPLNARKAVDDLTEDEGVIAILGPVFTYAAEPAAYRAQALGVPLLTISAAEGLGAVGPYVFRNGLTNRAQMKALVAHAMEIEGIRRFAVLYPRHPYGEELLHLFWDEVDRRQGEIRGVESYRTGDTTFTSQVKALVARQNVQARPDYKRAVLECKKQPDSYRRARCKERAAKGLKPIVDFEGLFIPDYPRAISMISAALAFEDIVVERDPRRLRIIKKTLGNRIKPIRLLGASGWNSPDVPAKSGRNVENALFTDGFFSGADEKHTQAFVKRYARAYRRTPRLYPEALLYDSARILAHIIQTEGPKTRNAMQEAIRRVHDFPGVAGKTSFAQGADAQKPVKILTIQNRVIREVPPPE